MYWSWTAYEAQVYLHANQLTGCCLAQTELIYPFKTRPGQQLLSEKLGDWWTKAGNMPKYLGTVFHVHHIDESHWHAFTHATVLKNHQYLYILKLLCETKGSWCWYLVDTISIIRCTVENKDLHWIIAKYTYMCIVSSTGHCVFTRQGSLLEGSRSRFGAHFFYTEVMRPMDFVAYNFSQFKPIFTVAKPADLSPEWVKSAFFAFLSLSESCEHPMMWGRSNTARISSPRCCDLTSSFDAFCMSMWPEIEKEQKIVSYIGLENVMAVLWAYHQVLDYEKLRSGSCHGNTSIGSGHPCSKVTSNLGQGCHWGYLRGTKIM